MAVAPKAARIADRTSAQERLACSGCTKPVKTSLQSRCFRNSKLQCLGTLAQIGIDDQRALAVQRQRSCQVARHRRLTITRRRTCDQDDLRALIGSRQQDRRTETLERFCQRERGARTTSIGDSPLPSAVAAGMNLVRMPKVRQDSQTRDPLRLLRVQHAVFHRFQ